MKLYPVYSPAYSEYPKHTIIVEKSFYIDFTTEHGGIKIMCAGTAYNIPSQVLGIELGHSKIYSAPYRGNNDLRLRIIAV